MPKDFHNPSEEFEITHAVIQLGLQIHQNMGDMKCGTLTNATEIIIEMALMQMRSYF